ncbi:MAG TPA: hypothetical protein VJU58_06150 [Microbacterium sp.]|nr:hypothetical protein [Microbacterium sp.]
MAWINKVGGKVDGVLHGRVKHEYLCPVHGRFAVEVPSADPPNEMPCPEDDWTDVSAAEACELVNRGYEPNTCGRTAPWSPSSMNWKLAYGGVTVSHGKADAAPTPHALTTRDLADGMPMNEWRAARAKLREERRRKRIKELR